MKPAPVPQTRLTMASFTPNAAFPTEAESRKQV